MSDDFWKRVFDAHEKNTFGIVTLSSLIVVAVLGFMSQKKYHSFMHRMKLTRETWLKIVRKEKWVTSGILPHLEWFFQKQVKQWQSRPSLSSLGFIQNCGAIY